MVSAGFRSLFVLGVFVELKCLSSSIKCLKRHLVNHTENGKIYIYGKLSQS